MGNKKKLFKVPVEWTVCDFVEVEAESFKDAIQYVIDNEDTIPLGTEPEYIDGTYKINSEDDVACDKWGNCYIEALAKHLESFGYGEGIQIYE